MQRMTVGLMPVPSRRPRRQWYRFRDPVRPDRRNGVAERRAASAGTTGSVDHAASTILVVDDFEPARRITARMLAEGGFTVIEAGDGFEALAACARQPVTVVVADVRMPRMTGFELGRRIAADWPHIRMLYVTGYPDEGDTDVGLNRIMYKPYAADQLVDVVQSLVDRVDDT